MLQIIITEIRNANSFYYRIAGDESGSIIDQSMKQFTLNYGIKASPCDVKVGKIVAALYDDVTGKSWYRAKILDVSPGTATVLFLDWGNIATVSVANNLRPLDPELGIDRLPIAANEATMALIRARDVDDEDGVEAARLFRRLTWDKTLTAHIFSEYEGKAFVALLENGKSFNSSINEEIVSEGMARAGKESDLKILTSRLLDRTNLETLFGTLTVAQSNARKFRRGMWRYGDIGDDDEDGY